MLKFYLIILSGIISTSATLRSFIRFESGCSLSQCGVNANCREDLTGRPICSCPVGFYGDPLTFCHKGGCSNNYDCRDNQECRDGECVSPCVGQCGINAICEGKNHVAVCSCPRNFNGNPFTYCSQPKITSQITFRDQNCDSSSCGLNAKCEYIKGQPTCLCLPYFKGNPHTGCYHECKSDNECGPQESCNDYKCTSACNQCGKNAICSVVINHHATCECPKGFLGSPYNECFTHQNQCETNADCPKSKPSCYKNYCKNLCDDACGINAECHLNGKTPVCSCPRGFIGDPFVNCQKNVPKNVCRPNPCGNNAVCTPKFDRNHQEKAVCTCPPGFTGNAISSCFKIEGECQNDSHCGDNKSCKNHKCINPCLGHCGVNSKCKVKNHTAICACPSGTTGNALIFCIKI